MTGKRHEDVLVAHPQKSAARRNLLNPVATVEQDCGESRGEFASTGFAVSVQVARDGTRFAADALGFGKRIGTSWIRSPRTGLFPEFPDGIRREFDIQMLEVVPDDIPSPCITDSDYRLSPVSALLPEALALVACLVYWNVLG